MTSAEIRAQLVDTLELDLIGPRPGLGDPLERLPQAPSRWYLSGFLVPTDAPAEQREDPTSTDDDLDAPADPQGIDDDPQPERGPKRRRIYPSSIGLSAIVPPGTKQVRVTAHWGDYRPEEPEKTDSPWARTPREGTVVIPLEGAAATKEFSIPEGGGMRVAMLSRPFPKVDSATGPPEGAQVVSIFLVNRRAAAPDAEKDRATAFQAVLTVECAEGFLARPDLRSHRSDEWDHQVADLQYRDAGDWATGHNAATRAVKGPSGCHEVGSCWLPRAEVERVAPDDDMPGELRMDELAGLANSAQAKAGLLPMVDAYSTWLAGQKAAYAGLSPKRRQTAGDLMQRAHVAASRIEAGIGCLDDPNALLAFRIANRAMAAAARKRRHGAAPTWRPFQLAFLLMNLRGIVDPAHDDRDTVDLLFFPTGGGKTEAYLGLAAFTLVLRRLRNPGMQSAGLAVLMRYTLRLLTLDQLGRAATLICALELERLSGPDRVALGDWSFEIGLWVGRAATPNRMGSKDAGQDGEETARRKVIAYLNDASRPIPIPIEVCPWCGAKLTQGSFKLYPNPEYPTELRIRCVNMTCEFARDANLPIVAVDEPIYRRLPCFLIATVDKFAGLPWVGEVGKFFGRASRHDKEGFYGPADGARGTRIPGGELPPPELIIQDELHLISGPLGTIAGLYEAAIEQLCLRHVDGKTIRPKIVASTATVRRAETQIRALFGRSTTDVFPPPGPDRRDSFFARTLPLEESPARLYVGVTAQGRSFKVAMLRVYVALLGASYKAYLAAGGNKATDNPADPYMTLLGYFNALRELGGARRLIQDEVRLRAKGNQTRKRLDEAESPFAERDIDYEPVELTSRVPTNEVSDAKRRLAVAFPGKGCVDVGIATNMISVGLDITRLGLMVVFGQPKTSAEYIQATSRVGRDPAKPGLVVTLLNIHKPRDRSHYERFAHYHETFYRSVEATSVTPFSPRALDRALAPAVVGLSRHANAELTPAAGARQLPNQRAKLEFVVDFLAERAFNHDKDRSKADRETLRNRVRERVLDLLDEWDKLVQGQVSVGSGLKYGEWDQVPGADRLLRDYLDSDLRNLPPLHWKMKFRANRSMRDVEPNSNLFVRTLGDHVDLGENE